MPISRPYPNIYRHGSSSDANAAFFELREQPEMQHFVASWDVLKRDTRAVFEYVEPHTSNLGVFSHRIFSLLLRACTEVEALSRVVFAKNGHMLGRSGNIIRFSDLEGPMKLSQYSVVCPEYAVPEWRPFESYAMPGRMARSPAWYRAYNSVKHNRSGSFAQASLEHLLGAAGGVFVLLAAQLGPVFDSTPQPFHPGARPPVGLMTLRSIPLWGAERYDFSWVQLREAAEPFQMHPIPVRP